MLLSSLVWLNDFDYDFCVQVKREQHHKARQQQEQGDPEAPQLDELIPDKLARVSQTNTRTNKSRLTQSEIQGSYYVANTF